MSRLIEILERLRPLYPNYEITLWTKEDKGKIFVNDVRVVSFNPQLLEQQLETLGTPFIEDTIRRFCEYIEKRYVKRAKRIGMGRPKLNLTEAQIRIAIENTKSCKAAARFLGVIPRTFKTYAELYGLYKQNLNKPGVGITRRGYRPLIPLQEIFDNLHPHYTISHLKNRLISEHVFEAKCEICGYDKQRISDGQAPLILDFRDGDRHNFAKENLRLICYHCTFDIYGKTNVKRAKVMKVDYDSRVQDEHAEETYSRLFDEFNKK